MSRSLFMLKRRYQASHPVSLFRAPDLHYTKPTISCWFRYNRDSLPRPFGPNRLNAIIAIPNTRASNLSNGQFPMCEPYVHANRMPITEIAGFCRGLAQMPIHFQPLAATNIQDSVRRWPDVLRTCSKNYRKIASNCSRTIRSNAAFCNSVNRAAP